MYVHCTAGINRSPLTVLSYLVLVEEMRTEEALSFIGERRPQAEPYLEAHEGCYRDLVQAHGDTIRDRAYEHWERSPGDTAETHWARAEREVLREVITAQ